MTDFGSDQIRIIYQGLTIKSFVGVRLRIWLVAWPTKGAGRIFLFVGLEVEDAVDSPSQSVSIVICTDGGQGTAISDHDAGSSRHLCLSLTKVGN